MHKYIAWKMRPGARLKNNLLLVDVALHVFASSELYGSIWRNDLEEDIISGHSLNGPINLNEANLTASISWKLDLKV